MLKRLARAGLAGLVLMAAAGAAEAGWEEGLAAFKAGDLAKAAAEFQAVVGEKPDWYGGYFMLGQVRLKQNQNQEALTQLRKAYDLNPGEPSVQLPLGKAFLAVGQYNDAARLLSAVDATKLSKAQQAAVYQMLAVAYGQTGRSEQAADALARAVAANPTDPDLQFQLGTAALSAGDTAAALRALERAASLDTRDTVKQRVYAQALIRSGRENQGAAKDQAYQKAVTVARALATREPIYENLLLLGEAELGSDAYAGAVSTFQQATAKNPRDWLPHFYIGQAHTASGSYGSAESALRQALNLTSQATDQARIWRQLGFVYEKKRDFNQAKSAYERAGDSAAARRVEENAKIEQFNQQVDVEAQRIKAIEDERKKLEEALKELPGGPPPGR